MTGYELKYNGFGPATAIGDEIDFYTDVKDYESTFAYGYTYMNTPSFAKGTGLSTKNSISMTWNVYERDAQLQVYRAEAKDGPYKLVTTVSGTKTQEQIMKKYGRYQVDFKDESVEKGKTYYYKAKSILTIADGNRESDFSDVYVFEAKNSKEPRLTSKLINRRGTYSKKLTWKVTSQKENYDVCIGSGWSKGAGASLYSYSSSTGKRVKKAVVRVEYSYDGHKFKTLKKQSQRRLKPGESIYLRVVTKSKVYIRKDGKGFANINIDYVVPDLNYGLLEVIEDSVDDMNLQLDGKVTINHFDNEDTSGERSFPYKDFAYYQNEKAWSRKLWGYAVDSRTAVVGWYMVPETEKFALRYGKTKEEAMKSKPIILPSYQINYKIDGIEENQAYYFLLTNLKKGESDNTYMEDRTVSCVINK